jgi:hypothetical protein
MSFTYGKKKIGVESPLSSFGEIRTAEMTPSAQGDFVYNINDKVFESIEYAGGYVSQAEGLGYANSSASTSGSAALQLRRALKYQAGQGSAFRGTAIFTTGTAGNIQILGIGNGECGYFFGYLQQNFGILHQPTSKREIRALTVTTGGATGNVTVTLDGDSVVVPITGNNDVTQTAFALSQADYRQVGNGWLADAVSGTVYFLSSRAGPLDNGAYSVSGNSVIGTFTRISAGVAPSSDFITQSNWNLDKMDGTGPSGMILNPQRGNIYEIGMQYLGFGNAFFGIEDTDSGRIVPVHEIKNANNRTTPVLRNPNVSGFIASSNIPGLGGVNVPVAGGSLATFIDGRKMSQDPKYAQARAFSIPNTSNVWKPVQAFKVNRVHSGQACFGEIDLLGLSATNTTGATQPKAYRIGIFVDYSVTGDVNFQNVSTDQSIVSTAALDPSTQSFSSASPVPIFSVGVNAGSEVVINLVPFDFIFGPGRLVIIGVISGDAIGAGFSFNWFEQQ